MILNPKRIAPLLLLFSLIFCLKLRAQSYLMKEISIKGVKQQTLASVLNNISTKQDFYFAYNNSIVPADSLVSITAFRGTIFSFLEQTLGEHYEFKEVPGYIVLTFAPEKLTISAELIKDLGTPGIVKGYIRDVSNNKGIPKASVYEKNLLISALTNDRGYFELKLKNYNGPVKLTASKENYRDTSMLMLADVMVYDKQIDKNYRYYPDDKLVKGIWHSRFARFFVGSKQLVQGLNLGNYFATAPYQISLIPGLSTHGMYNSQVIDQMSFNLIGGYTAGINGCELAGVFNINRKNMRYLQAAGIFNFVGDSTAGLQMAGAYNNVLNSAGGIQVAGLINQSNTFRHGLQMAGVANFNRTANGLQVAGFANFDHTAKGLQLAGVVNKYHTDKGVAIAGVTNIGSDSSYVQLAGVFNVAKNVSALQLTSFLNVAKKVKGIQLGIINIADSCDYQIGILNINKIGGKSVAISTDENAYMHLDFRSGGNVLYSLLGAGYALGSDKDKFIFDIGMGVHIVNNRRFFLNGEYVFTLSTDLKKDINYISAIKVLPGFKLNKHLAFFAGPSINLISQKINDQAKIHGWIIRRYSDNSSINTATIGLTGGFTFMW